MYEEFKASGIGIKPWAVTDEGISYKGKMFKYAEIGNFSLITTPSTGLTNGVINLQSKTSRGAEVLAFKYADKERAHKIIDFVNQKIQEANGIAKDYKFIMRAHTGTSLEVYETYLVLKHMQVGSLLTNIARGGALAGKKINYSDLTSVQFREPAGLTVGFIQFAYPGCVESKGGITDMLNDENSIPVQPSDIMLARQIVEYIEQRKAELKQPQATTIIQQNSTADEIKKFKELLDCGVITQEEFDAKKKQLLGL